LPPPPDEPVDDTLPPSPYPSQSATNTAPTYGSELTADVEADLDDLKGYSLNLDEIQGNFAEVGRGVADPLRDAVDGAFPVGNNHGLEWEANMNSLAKYNAYQLQAFVFNMALGIRNVASAAQAVANSYSNTDDTSAASLGSIFFAFGDKSQAPSGFPSWVLDKIPTWNDVMRENPPVPPAEVPKEGLDPGAVDVQTNGNVTTTTVHLPGGGTMVTKEEHWSGYGSVGTTTTVTVNGKPVSTSTTYTYGGRTVTEDKEYVYDEHGNQQGEPRVTSEREVSVTRGADGSERTEQSSTTYQYDTDGEATPSTSGSAVTVGPERPSQGMIQPGDDPAQRALEELMPEPDPDEVILAPGPMGGDPGGGQSPSEGVA